MSFLLTVRENGEPTELGRHLLDRSFIYKGSIVYL